ncbi:MAG: prepilin peptidase [Candidatus Shapirobacteria bacterium]
MERVRLMMFVLLFLFGLGVGSFLNVVIWRLNHHLSPVAGRSFCPKCRHKLSWYDNIPLLSFVLLRGRCRCCRKKISLQYPIVELATAILTLQIFFNYYNFYNLLLTYALIIIFVSDLRYYIIPDEVIYPLLVISLIFFPQNFLIGLASAGLFLFLVVITRQKGMGWGDVKLAGLMGLVLGWPNILTALYLAFLTGALAGVILILIKRKRFGQIIPFGPFLAGATYLALLYGEEIKNWALQNWFHFG